MVNRDPEGNPNNQDPAATPKVDNQSCAGLTVAQLTKVLSVNLGPMQQATKNWGNLHDTLADFLGTSGNGPTPPGKNFPALVDSLKNWQGAAAEEFRKYAKSITDLATGLMQVAGSAADTRTGTLNLITDDVSSTVSSAQQNVFEPLQSGFPAWLHTVYSILTDHNFWSDQGVFNQDDWNHPAWLTGKTDAGDPVSFTYAGRDGDNNVHRFEYRTNRFSAYGPYWVRGTLSEYVGGWGASRFVSVSATAVDPSSGKNRAESTGTIDPATLGAPNSDYSLLHQTFEPLYHDQLVILAEAVGYRYALRRPSLPTVPQYVPPQPGSGGNGGGGGGGGAGGPGDYAPGPLSSPYSGGTGLTDPNAFSGNSDGLAPSGYDPSGSDPSAYDPSAYDPSAYDPGAYDPGTYDPSSYDPYGGGTGSLAGANLPGGSGGLYTPGAGSGLGGLGGGAGGGLGGADGSGGLGAGAGGPGSDAAGTAGAAGRGMPMSPGAGAGAGKESKDRQRQSWLPEEDDVWGADTDAPDGLL